jgi:hypothetical protein
MYSSHDILDERSSEERARHAMVAFARRTGLAPPGPQRRYLWTDAFALTNYLTLWRRSGDDALRRLAIGLIDRVHHTLGRHRPDDRRDGWISGLEDDEAERHPTAGGLRIGKARSERAPGEPYDPDAEWDRDGQYYHYLVRWMHALSRASDVLDDPRLNQWAVELAVAAHRGFTYAPPGGGTKRMYWKMSIELTRPLVSSEGGHDPLDGLVTFSELEARGRPDGDCRDLGPEITELEPMCRGREWATADPLGAGGLLSDAWWTAQLVNMGVGPPSLEPLLTRLVEASVASVRAVLEGHLLRLPFDRRLAFRELGLSIGLQAASALVESRPRLSMRPWLRGIDELERYLPLGEAITSAWLQEEARATSAWKAHEDINEVMLATALTPDEHIRV